MITARWPSMTTWSFGCRDDANPEGQEPEVVGEAVPGGGAVDWAAVDDSDWAGQYSGGVLQCGGQLPVIESQRDLQL